MSNDDTATERPAWAHDAMNDDDVAFVNGYIDAVGWLPTADPNELADFLWLAHNRRAYFEMMQDHTLARYKGWAADPGSDGMLGISAGDFNKDGAAIGYAAGIAAVLRIHRPELDREGRKQDLDTKRQKIQATLAGQQAQLAKVDAELAALGQVG